MALSLQQVLIPAKCLMTPFCQDFVRVPTKCIMRTVRLIILQIVEVSRAIEIFQRSESLNGLRCTKLLGDGESRAYKSVNEMQPYGDTCIEKMKCVRHVEKRMGTRLRALKLKMKGKKLSDEKTLDGCGRFTDAEIDKLQRYLGLANRNNTDSINSMKRAI
ncbi:uncharacterized protein TNCV_4125681 [Trichonephila clavipes]|nr:uncharacterized protein TNCV_4125681 [Trichonephila clavipes]